MFGNSDDFIITCFDKEFMSLTNAIELTICGLFCEKDISELHILMDELDVLIRKLKNLVIENIDF